MSELSPFAPLDEGPLRNPISDTPRTDALDSAFTRRDYTVMVHSLFEHARQLERELSEAKQRADWMSNHRKTVAEWYQERNGLRTKLATLEKALNGLRSDYDLNNCRANKAEQERDSALARNNELATENDILRSLRLTP